MDPRRARRRADGSVLVAELRGAALGESGTLTEGEYTTVLLDAFGPEALTWTRVVQMSAPLQMQVVAAPIGEHVGMAAKPQSRFSEMRANARPARRAG